MQLQYVNWNHKKIAIFVSVFVFIIFFLWRHHAHSVSDAHYRTLKIQKGDVTQTVAANGTLNPVTLVTVGSSVSGKVLHIYADFNDQVKVGQVLLDIDPALYQAAVEQSTAQINKAETALKLATANLERGTVLYKQDYLAKQDWDQLVQTQKSAKADLELAKARLNSDKTNLDYTIIHSPIDGVVVDREVDVGQTVAASFQTPVLYKIAQDLKKMQIDSSFAEADIGNIKPGQETTFTVDAYPNRTFKGIVKQIRLNPTTQQNVVTYDVVILVDNPDGVLFPGMTAYVNIKVAERKNVLLIPNAAFRFKPKQKSNDSALTKTASANYVYKLQENGRLARVECKTGITDNKVSEIITSDLQEGDAIVVGDNGEAAGTPTSGFRVRMF